MGALFDGPASLLGPDDEGFSTSSLDSDSVLAPVSSFSLLSGFVEPEVAFFPLLLQGAIVILVSSNFNTRGCIFNTSPLFELLATQKGIKISGSHREHTLSEARF